MDLPDRSIRGDTSATEPSAVRAHLSAILGSGTFANAKSAGRFLQFVVEETLAGRGGQLKEYSIGVAVFGRGEHFDARVDAVVRVEAIRLRERLSKYYQDAGRTDRVIIEIPKGAYVPAFRRFDPTLSPEPSRARKANFESSGAGEAYDHYLRGRFYSQRQNKGDNETAIAAFERAIAIDRHFAAAYAELAQAYIWKLFLFAPDEKEWEEKAFVAIEKALNLNPNLAVAHLARGRLLWTPANSFPHEKAIREYRRALVLDPNLDEARNQLALIYCHIGYFEEALEESEKATLANPNNHLALYRMAQTYVFQGRFEEALSILQALPGKVNPALIGYQTAWVLFNLGRIHEASTTVAQLLKDYPEDSGGVYTSVQAVLAASRNELRRTQSKIARAIELGRGFGHFHHTAYHIAVAYTLIGQKATAVRWLESAAMDGFPCYPLFKKDSNLDGLRRDKRFDVLMEKLKRQWLNYRRVF